MNEMMFDWDDLRLFLAVARKGGLAGAAASTGKSAPTLGRRMLALERRLGRDLFRRLPRGYALTEAGETLFSEALVLEDRLRPIVEIDPARAVPVVKISAGTWVTHLLCTNIRAITGRDAVRLRFIAAEQMLDIGRREAVIGVRNQRPEGPGLAGRRIARVRFAVYARAPDIETWVRVVGLTPSAKWRDADGSDAPALEVTSPRNALDLALAGAARVVLPTFVGARFAPLRQMGPEIPELEHDQWLVTHHEDRFLPPVRKVIDRVHSVLRSTGAGDNQTGRTASEG